MLTPPHIKAINVPKVITVQKVRPDLVINHVNQVLTTPRFRATRRSTAYLVTLVTTVLIMETKNPQILAVLGFIVLEATVKLNLLQRVAHLVTFVQILPIT